MHVELNEIRPALHCGCKRDARMSLQNIEIMVDVVKPVMVHEGSSSLWEDWALKFFPVATWEYE